MLHTDLAHWTLMIQETRVRVLDLLRLKTYLELPVHRVDVVLDILELGESQGEDHLGQVLPADGALVPLAEDPHPGAADVADGVVALPHAPDLDLVHADLADLLPLLTHLPLLSLTSVHLGDLILSLGDHVVVAL